MTTDTDPLTAARGILFAVALGCVLWAVVIALVIGVVR